MSYNASELAPNITIAVRALKEEYPNAPLYVAGHSMGAAMAHICALDLKFTLGFDDVNVYTYGSPRVGNDIFKDFFNKIVNVSCTEGLLCHPYEIKVRSGVSTISNPQIWVRVWSKPI